MCIELCLLCYVVMMMLHSLQSAQHIQVRAPIVSFLL
jgi:hypothetical protein